MKTREEIEKERAWQLAHIDCLKGRTIKRVAVHEHNSTVFPVLELDDETLVVVQSDAEANGSGFLNIVPREESTPASCS